MADCLCSGLGMMSQDYFPNFFENVVVRNHNSKGQNI